MPTASTTTTSPEPLGPSPYTLLTDVMTLLHRQGYQVAWDGNGEAVAAAEALIGSLDISARRRVALNPRRIRP
jgi:hypothetical protein